MILRQLPAEAERSYFTVPPNRSPPADNDPRTNTLYSEGYGEVSPDAYADTDDRGLSEEEFQSLQRKRILRFGTEAAGPRPDNCKACGVYMDVGQIVVNLRCSHCFHEQCAWGFLQNGNRCCGGCVRLPLLRR